MIEAIRKTVRFMTPKERARLLLLVSLRALVAILDLIGILSIGFIAASIALFLTQGSDPNRTIAVGELSIPAINASNLPFIAFGVLALFLLKALFSILLTKKLAVFLARIEARSSRVIAEAALGQGLNTARRHSRDELIFAVQVGSPSAFNGLLNALSTLVAEGFLFFLVLSSFALVDIGVAFGAVIYFGLIALVIQVLIGKWMLEAGERVAAYTLAGNAVLSDLGEVIRESTVLGRQRFFFDNLYRSRLSAAESGANQLVLSGLPRYIVESALMVAVAIFVLFQAMSGDVASTAATLGVFLSGGLRLTASLLPLQGALLTIKQSLPASVRALEFLGEPETPKSFHPDLEPLLEERSAVRVKLSNVNFQYSANSGGVLQDITLEINPGTQAAIIGPSGAGKSTVADLILGLLSPDSGTIELDGFSSSTMINANPGAIGYVPQKPGMVSGSLAQNIALGLDPQEVDPARLKKAIADAHLTELVASLPNGVETDIGKRKDELSGGQLQRVGLARALYSLPQLLIMDEATSALDAESEHEINKAIDALRGKVTVILIAHRLNTVQRSDIVFLLEEGKLTASGTFPDLLKSNVTIRRLTQLMSVDLGKTNGSQ